MKKTSLSMRILAMVLVLIMTVQLVPASVFAFGELKSVETGIDVNTLKKEDAINWPIKIYDYLDDGMLFEWNDSQNSGTKMATGNSDGEGNTTPYGGGAAPVWTKLGVDYTYNGAATATDYDTYTDSIKEAVDYKTPRYLKIAGKGYQSSSVGNYQINTFSTGKAQDDIRYVTVVYRSSGLSKVDLTIALHNGSWNRTYGAYLPDSSQWTYKVIDLNEIRANKVSNITTIYFMWGYIVNNNGAKRGMPANAYCDLSHVAYFDNLTEAENYGKAAATFDNNPGEYLRHKASFTATTTTVTPSANLRSSYLFSLNYHWKTANASPIMGEDGKVRYGMDFTTTSKAEGDYTNGYTTNSYWTWANGSTQTYKYTDSNTNKTGTYTFAMDSIGVEQKVESNGAMYVRLTSSKNSKILLSKFREDTADSSAVTAGLWVPPTSAVENLVLVYRVNGLDQGQDRFGLWAQGYDESTADYTKETVGRWKYAGLVGDNENWTTSAKVNKQDFKYQGGWQYQVISLSDIGENDSMMDYITRICRTGLYLPAMESGESLDLAYVAYFAADQKNEAEDFGNVAVNYMNSAPKVSTSTSTKSYGNSRYWTTGNNKSFGMLFATGYGAWDGGTAGGTNTSAIGYDSWIIGYHTGKYSGDVFNTNRKNPITGEKYTAKYTGTSSYVTKQNVSGTTNHTYLIYPGTNRSNDGTPNDGYDTSILDFDGYQLLEKVVSGLTTVGLLEGSLRTVRVDNVEYRVPVYRQETVEYIAYLLVNALRIPQRDANGNYYSNFISGSKSTQFGGVDLNGDGKIGMINLDGDSRNGNECNEASVDLATALRHCLGISLPVGASVGTYATDYKTTLGSYEETLKKDELLIGKFQDCRFSIKTAMDAAYYMLNSLFVANSFNQKQDDYYYLNMPMAQVTTNNHSGDAYVFDAGFTTGKTDTVGNIFTDTTGTNKSAISYSPVIDADGKAGTGTIYLSENSTGKTYFNYSSGTDYAWTTRFPFLPVTDAEGDYAGQTKTYYYWADDYRTYTEDSNSYIDRNYNYVIASNGEFVYKENDDLFFEFEGDDDVYLFINGELVLDIGAGHSITSVYIDVNDYVKSAREVMKDLYDYGYTNEMTIEKFDKMITGDTLQKYVYNSDGKITGTETVSNPFTAEQIANYKRWARLDLVDGQICQFDFYYMERHGWGANMRIVTNMHITDPSLDVDKTAYQYGQEIEFGGVIDPTASLEYNFSLTNNGNQKLYNLTFEDKVIGVKLDPTDGLVVQSDKNGIYVRDYLGKTLEAKDLTATVSGYNAIGQYTEVPITFPEVDGDGGQAALKSFLKKLSAQGTEQDYDDAEITHAGSGLWVDATVTIKGIHYMLTPEQIEAGQVHNTVYLTATTRIDPATVGSQTLKSDAEHLIYTSGFPVHYQWAGHNIFIKMAHLLEESKEEATNPNSQLNLYNKFFNSVDDLGDIYYNICDKYGRTGGVYPFHTKDKDHNGNPGYFVNYDEPGIYTFYLLMYKRQGASKYYAETGVDAEDIAEGEYAILRSQVYVADVEDSVYVLDYGLSTESLDLDGELFKNDHLFGPYGTIRAKLMGVTNQEPKYLDPAEVLGTDYCRIAFQAQNLTENNVLMGKNNYGGDSDGIFKVNLAIPEDGKLIGYDSATGKYTITGVGTVKINAVVPTDGYWKEPCLYYWYDDGTPGPAWPGTPMKELGAGQFEIDIPADVTNVIINNGSGALQTNDLRLTPGLESTIYVSVSNSNVVSTRIETIMEEVTIHVKAPSDWKKVYLHHWHDNGEGTEFPGEEVTGELDANGYMTIKIHGDVTNMLLTDGAGKQTGDLNVYAGKEAWIEVGAETGNLEGEDGTITTYFDAGIRYTLSDGYKVHASVPTGWKENVYIYYWHEGMTDDEMTWPGKLMEKGEFGWYTLPDGELIPADVTQIVINDGNDGNNHQTVDLTITPGLETWIMVNNSTTEHNGQQKYTAKVAYGSETGSTGLTFTPRDFMDEHSNMWLAITVHATSANPSKLNSLINIHQEVQMYKKISVLPATIVYYEDTFGAVEYNKNDASSENVFTHHGNGSGLLSQSIDQDQPYGQDAAYQDAENDLYSGGSLTEIEIRDDSVLATFDFVGTGFEIIGRTTAVNPGAFTARVYKYNDYSPTAYADYMAKVNEYLNKLDAYYNVPVTYDAADSAWKYACEKYDLALEAFHKAQEAYADAQEADKVYKDLVAVASAAKAELEIKEAEMQAAKAAFDVAMEKQEGVENAKTAYDNAVQAWNEAAEAFEAAEQAASDQFKIRGEKFEAYRIVADDTYYSISTYEVFRKKYEDAANAYANALATYVGNGSTFTVAQNLGKCRYENGFLTYPAPESKLDVGTKPTAPIEPTKLVPLELQLTAPEAPFITVSMVYTQFDHGNNGGAESLNQVPVIRVNGLDGHDTMGYVVELAGQPMHTYNDQFDITGVQPTKLSIDGVRIYKPMEYYEDMTGEKLPYNDKEHDATVEELRDQIATGNVGVAVMGNTGLNVSAGTTTWTEALHDNDFDPSSKETYNSIKVESTADYLIQGPNNEVYMEGSATNSALIFYVQETDSKIHELQIAVRALDYGRYYGAGSTGLNAQLQYGVLSDGEFAWKNLVQVVSGTEQYYSIPYDECPMDTQGRYQIMVRAVNPNKQSSAMVSYTNLKLNGLAIVKMEGVGEGSIIYYENGILVKPQYELGFLDVVDGAVVEADSIPFNGNELTLTMDSDHAYVYVKSTFKGEKVKYYANGDPGPVTSATMYLFDDSFGGCALNILDTMGKDITFKIKQVDEGSLVLSYCMHTYGEGIVAREPNCSITGIMVYTCTECGHIKQEPIETNDVHHYSGGICKYCGTQEPKFYLVGYINGKNHGCEGDYANMGNYLFVDGKLNVHFEKDSYVYLKADGNKVWYMVPSYVTENTATFYDTTTGNYGEKMYVPCGVDLVFTLTVNDDGSLTLHYEEPCKHDWGTGEITWPATCTADGERTYTCSKCYQTKKELIPATGHSYVNGICVCGDVEMRTIYFQNTDGWENVYLYAWVDGGAEYTERWPGNLMEWVEGDIYKATVPSYLKVIFTNDAGAKSDDLDIPPYEDMFVWSSKIWVNHSGEQDYYLVGSINGVDYGYGDNSNNMGAYKFVDGKLTVTFDKESYVFVKTTGNAAWYMTQTYCDTYSATLYNTTTGANEKMFVPAGTEIEFTLTVNDDDTLSLVAHSWGGVVTKQPSCTEPGEKTYTCYLCNDSYTEVISANGHNFVDDVCSACGEVDTRIVYFKNTAGWADVYIWAWTEGGDNYTGGVWPGAQMSLVEGETDLYYYVLSAKAKSVIFSTSSGVQTDNLHAPVDENNKYTYGANVWTPVDQDVEVEEPEVEYLYLNPGDQWPSDGAWFAANFFGNGDTWAKMTDDDGDGIYQCVKPEGYTNVIFCRMRKDLTDLGWDSKWNQTTDLSFEGNFFTITGPWEGDGQGATGTWSTYTCSHAYTEEITTAPGCETTGLKTFTCSKCGHSYTEEIASTGHSYEGVVTTPASCTVSGVKTFTCAGCGDSYTEDILANGHSYVDGICGVCGEAEGKTVYFRNNWLWTNVSAYYWNANGELVSWPGTAMDYYGNDGTYDIYSITIPYDASVIIIGIKNDGSGAEDKTPDITDAYNGACYSMAWNDGNAVEVKDIAIVMCKHEYTEQITTAATCTTSGLKTLTCSKCGDSYTQTINATGHSFQNGTCTGCGEVEPTEPVILYLKPSSNWYESNARFAAYFYGNGDTWLDMTDEDGDGIYQVQAPEGYPIVIVCRMNPATTENNWDSKWNQTGDLVVPTGDATLCTIPDGNWNPDANAVSWSVYAATHSLRSTRKTNKTSAAGEIKLPECYIYGDKDVVMNLAAINAQMSSSVIFGQPDEIIDGTEGQVDINSASLVLSDDICMNYYVSVPAGAENVYMTFQLNGETTTVTDYTIDANGRYVFCFAGINPQLMGDDICATVYATVGGKQITDCVAAYSVRAYCVSQLNKFADDDKLVRLISDLLVYGAKNQIYQGYKTDKLVTEGLELKPSTFPGVDESENVLHVSGLAHKAVRYSGVTLVLGNKVVLRLTVQTNDPDAFTYTVSSCGVDTVYTGEDLVKVSDGKYYLYFDELKATGFDETVTATISCNGENVSQTVTYSVNSYIQKNQNAEDEALRELVQAIYNYGRSADDYAG